MSNKHGKIRELIGLPHESTVDESKIMYSRYLIDNNLIDRSVDEIRELDGNEINVCCFCNKTWICGGKALIEDGKFVLYLLSNSYYAANLKNTHFKSALEIEGVIK